jgi:2-C-methyl-D-erythritol 2,4-cyclodiphosphate synthase
VEVGILYRIGNGYDVHRLVEGRKLILGGIEIPFEKGLLGHSDADVLIHAIMDGLLGALALGDIGQHFPDTDERYKGISSIKLLNHVKNLIDNEGFEIVNIDSQIVMQQPKLKPYILEMRGNLAKELELPLNRVSVKATTEEKLGFTGEEVGVKSYAVVLLKELVMSNLRIKN